MFVKRRIVLLLACGILVATSGDGLARQRDPWPYPKLFKEADLVIIVKAISTREAKADDGAHPPEQYRDFLEGIVTRLKVVHVVKGDYVQEKLDLVHFRYKKVTKPVIDGPSLVSFHSKPIPIQGDFWSASITEPEYMLFLKKSKDGRFTFVSGQVDPDQSVRQMLSPLP
jgi:hypothetical protein